MKFLEQLKVLCVKDASQSLLPGQLINLAVEQCYAFAKIFRRHVKLLDDLARLGLDLPERRMAFFTCALVKESVAVVEALSERLRIMRIRLHYFISVYRHSGRF